MKTYIIAFLLVVSSFIGGSMYGFNQGVNNYYRIESIPTAVLHLSQYKNLENNKVSHVQNYQSLHIDMAIDNYLWYKNDGNHLLSNYYLAEHVSNIDDYIDTLISFRKVVPSDDISNLLDGEDKKEYLQKLKTRNDFINR